MRKLMAAALLGTSIATAACSHDRAEAAGPTVSRNYAVGDFSRIDVGGSFDVDVRTGARPSVQVEGSQTLLDRLTVEVKGDRLRIGTKRNRGWFGGSFSHGKGKVHITVPRLTEATLAGAGAMHIDKVEGDRFEGQIAGSGDLRIGSVAVNALKLGIAGAGKAEAAGRAGRAEYEIAGSGDVRAGGLNAQDLDVSISGSGNVAAHATRSATVGIAGSGDVDISGGAKCQVHKAGVGKVRCS